jgi:6-pyruvoyltetrahydropterin/6-carboxytetrahydropterin synthase
MYHVTKHYPHSLGLSVCFRQPGADSHCRFPHGYALAFTFEFEGVCLDKNNWLIDFGKLKPLKQWLVDTFDHKTLIAEDDIIFREPMFDLTAIGHADVLIVTTVGMESFAAMAFQKAHYLLKDMGETPRVRLTKVTVAEHEGNSASYSEPL